MKYTLTPSTGRQVGKSKWAEEVEKELIASGRSVTKVYLDADGKIATKVITPEDFNSNHK